MHTHAWQVHGVRWFYDVLLEKHGGGVNPAATSTVKQLMKALSYLMGQRRVYVPKALTREILEAVCRIVSVDELDKISEPEVAWGSRETALQYFLTTCRCR